MELAHIYVVSQNLHCSIFLYHCWLWVVIGTKVGWNCKVQVLLKSAPIKCSTVSTSFFKCIIDYLDFHDVKFFIFAVWRCFCLVQLQQNCNIFTLPQGIICIFYFVFLVKVYSFFRLASCEWSLTLALSSIKLLFSFSLQLYFK